MSPDNIVLIGEISGLRARHAKLAKDLGDLTGGLSLANKRFAENSAKIRVFNIELAVHEKEMKEMQGHIFALKKRRTTVGSPRHVEEEFNRQETLLKNLTARHRELNSLLLEIESNTKLFEQTMSDKGAIVERLSTNIDDLRPRRKSLAEEVSGLEAIAKIFIEAEQLSRELGTLTTAINQHTNELNDLKAFISAAEPETANLDVLVGGLQQRCDTLERETREIQELLARKSSSIEAVERLDEQEKALSLEVGKLQRELDKQAEILGARKAVNETNRLNAPSLEKELSACNEMIAEARENLAKHSESKKKKEGELNKFAEALASKLRLESELLSLEEGVAALGENVRSAV
jgi:chromosome segregation ATPase